MGKVLEVPYEVLGEKMQTIEFSLKEGRSIMADYQSMLYMEQGIRLLKLHEVQGVTQWLKGFAHRGQEQVTAHESLIHFMNEHPHERKIVFGPSRPAIIVSVDLEHQQNCLYLKRENFLCCDSSLKVEQRYYKTLMKDEEQYRLVYEKLTGRNRVFLQTQGTLTQKDLSKHDTIRVDANCLVAFSQSVDLDLQWMGIMNLDHQTDREVVMTTIKGPGSVWIQSIPS